MLGEPRHRVDRRLIMVETEAALAFESAADVDDVFVDVPLPGVP